MLRSNKYLLVLALVVIIISCSSLGRTKQSATTRFKVEPVNLYIKGIEKDSSIKSVFYEAFAKNKIKLITSEEMQRLADIEVKRVSQIVFSKDANHSGADGMMKAMSKEHKYVSNNLTVILELEGKDDSLIILKAAWVNFPFPPDIGKPSSVTKPRELDLTNLSFSKKENIYAIVDSILYSKELK